MSTPAGVHAVPAAVQALLAVEWSATLCTDDEFRCETRLTSGFEVGPIVDEETPRAWYAIGWDEGQWFLLVDLAEAGFGSGDFPVYRVDHEGGEEAPPGYPLWAVLSGLRIVADHIVFPQLEPATGGRHVLPYHGPQAVAEIDGRAVLATLAFSTLKVYDLVTGTVVVDTVLDSDQDELAVAELDSRWIAVTGSSWPSGRIRRWNLADGNPIGDPVEAHRERVGAIAVTLVGERPVVVTGGPDGDIRTWDLRTLEPIGEPVVGHRPRGDSPAGITCIAVGELDGRPVAVTGGDDGARVWTLDDGPAPGLLLSKVTEDEEEPDNPYDWVDVSATSAALGVVDGVPVALTCDRGVTVWNLRTGEQLGEMPDKSHYVALTRIADRPVAVTVGNDSVVRTWDLATRTETGSVSVEECSLPSGIATAETATRQLAVVTGYDTTVALTLPIPA